MTTLTHVSKTIALVAIASLAVVLFVGGVADGSANGNDDGGWCHIRSNMELTAFGTGRPYTPNDIGRPVFIARWVGDLRYPNEIRNYGGEWKSCTALPRARVEDRGSDDDPDDVGERGARSPSIVATVAASPQAALVVTNRDPEAECRADDAVHYKWITCIRSYWAEGDFPWD